MQGFGTPDPHIVQESTVVFFFWHYILLYICLALSFFVLWNFYVYLTFFETFLLSLLPTHSPHSNLSKSFAVASTQPPTQDSWSNQIVNRGLCSCSMVILGISKIQAPKFSHFIKLSVYSSASLGHNCIPSNSWQQPLSSSFVKLRKLTLPPGIISEPSFSSPCAIPSKLQVQSS